MYYSIFTVISAIKNCKKVPAMAWENEKENSMGVS